MTFDLSQAGLSTVRRYKVDHPNVFWCKDFPFGTCCEDCHAKDRYIAIYPWSAFARIPDLTLGLRAEVCCGRFHEVRELPRGWWLQKYGEKSGWREADIKKLIEAPVDRYYKTIAEISSRYLTGVAPQASAPRVSRGVSRQTKRGCPKCGSPWDSIVCDSCGHS